MYCDADNCCKVFMAEWNKKALEIMAILILYHQSHYQNIKLFYLDYVINSLSKEFSKRLSYNRFIELEHSVLIPLSVYLETHKHSSRAIAFINSSSL
jgi:hypothetical protein